MTGKGGSIHPGSVKKKQMAPRPPPPPRPNLEPSLKPGFDSRFSFQSNRFMENSADLDHQEIKDSKALKTLSVKHQ